MPMHPSNTTQRPARRGDVAVVVGASMAGLCAARVLADRFDRVEVLDRDDLPEHPAARRNVPQGRHPHLLLTAGARLIEGWFPGVLDELAANGAVDVDLCRDVHWYQLGGVACRVPSDLHSPSMTRPLLEHVVRRRLEALGNVRTRSGCTVRALEVDAGGSRVTGVDLEDGTTVVGDVVVDATGRQARSLHWLEALGYEPPSVSVVHVDTRYVTQVYRRGERPARDWLAAVVIDDPVRKRFAMAVPIEGDRWFVLLGGINGESPPTGEAERLAYARSFPSPLVAQVMEGSEPLGDVVTHRYQADQRRHVEKLRRFPVGWFPLGDAVCSFNPIYGQGMTAAAMQAAALGRCLDRAGAIDRELSRRYFRAASRVIAGPWSIATGGDFAYPGSTGDKAFGTDVVNRYVDRATITAQHDPTVARQLAEVFALVRRPEWLLSPLFAAHLLRRRRPAPAPPDPAATPPRPGVGTTGTAGRRP